ncbi:MAG: hypothetical protein P4L49_00160 [Desulfosporosinus sp.]|nr:hypothetical protein [Desulfosporosinus sp.]
MQLKGDKSEKDWHEEIIKYGATEEDIENERRDLTRKFGTYSEEDVIASIFNHLIFKQIEKGDHLLEGKLHYSRAIFLQGTDRNPNIEIKLALSAMLQYFKHLGVKKVRVDASKCCIECKKLDGEIYIIGNAIK